MDPSERSRDRQRKISALAIIVMAIWIGFLFDPMLRPFLISFIGLLLAGAAVVGAGMLLGAFGFGLTWGFKQNQHAPAESPRAWDDFSQEVPAAKPSGPPRWTKLILPLLVGFLLLILGLSLSGDKLKLLPLIFGSLLLCFGVFIVLSLLAGLTMACARAIREVTGSPTHPHPTDQIGPWS